MQEKTIKPNSEGSTLIELMVVLAIISILVMMVVSVCNIYVDKTSQLVCETNRMRLEHLFYAELAKNSYIDTPNAFKEFSSNFMREHDKSICPSGGIIEYRDGKFICLQHSRLKCNEQDEDGEGKPYL